MGTFILNIVVWFMSLFFKNGHETHKNKHFSYTSMMMGLQNPLHTHINNHSHVHIKHSLIVLNKTHSKVQCTPISIGFAVNQVQVRHENQHNKKTTQKNIG